MPDRIRWERRWNPLREEWVVYAAHRNTRPWNGAAPGTTASSRALPENCHLCPGKTRVGGVQNPDYTGVLVFDNDHPVLGASAPDVTEEQFPFPGYERARAYGLARVICYHHDHTQSLSGLAEEEVGGVLRVFRQQTREMKSRTDIRSVFIFENHGEAAGVSNMHPHAQLYAGDFPWQQVSAQLDRSTRYRKAHGVSLFEAIVANELSDGRRVLFQDDHAVAFIPYFARYPFETMIFPRSSAQDLTSLSDAQIRSMARALRSVLRKMNGLYDMDFPYVLSVMQAPVDGAEYPDYRAHLWLQPPYRQPGLIKFLAGPELGAGNFMADTLPEEKARELNEASSD